MIKSVSVSIDVNNVQGAINFYTKALGCEFKTSLSENWAIVSIGVLDIHLQGKEAGTSGAGEETRHYNRHWTPLHLDFSVDDISALCSVIEDNGGSVESQSFGQQADIAMCADPFGNGFCVIRE